jgi:TfoX/Sxy family transcriptional regulator of competence genes
MKLAKPSPGLIAEFKAIVAGLAGAEPRKMFGYDAFFVNGNLAAGLWQDTCVFKLSPADAKEFMKYPEARPFAPMKGRVMTGWFEAPQDVSHDAEALAEWCRRALAFARTLPPKGPKLAPKKPTQATPKKPTKKSKARSASQSRPARRR